MVKTEKAERKMYILKKRAEFSVKVRHNSNINTIINTNEVQIALTHSQKKKFYYMWMIKTSFFLAESSPPPLVVASAYILKLMTFRPLRGRP